MAVSSCTKFDERKTKLLAVPDLIKWVSAVWPSSVQNLKIHIG